MIVVIGFTVNDHNLCRKLAAWMKKLGPYPGHRAMLVRDSRVTDEHHISNLLRECFDQVQEVTYPDDGHNQWAFSANKMFNRAAKEIQYSPMPLPWLWCEPDAVPMRKGWLDELVKEYDAERKPFLGDRVAVDDVPLHCSGVAIYPPRITDFAWKIGIADDVAWDCFAADQIVPNAHFTEKIVHNWQHGPFKSMSEVDNLRSQHPEMVLFHSDKSGTLIDWLEKELTLPVAVGDRTAPVAEVAGDGHSIPAHVGPTDLFIKTY